ncbi:hypothetical protein NEICINOT_05028 [Neisseria cinerea ATCC 14685]|uniref:Uncharacterized protein n=1 Tax=Neisseria cinerea ATCC 14685 TaxID=546262 RepID=D0W5Q9_NEICI|nr:hypothetical protein NEICINOT_05028 [Neisseria cinerea ATCC 14685]
MTFLITKAALAVLKSTAVFLSVKLRPDLHQNNLIKISGFEESLPNAFQNR